MPREDGWLLHTNHFLDRAFSVDENSTTRLRFEHLQRVVPQMISDNLAVRADVMCGVDGDASPTGFHPDMTPADMQRWETLLTVGIDTASRALEYAAANPYGLSQSGLVHF
ncbi:hypothetical protein [Paraburkholderia sp. BL6669N2]|uniref:hypothetical protein n=1 Tax=Paraburkholderia sp. BL6669N2 TaxID=1938807 RepID=UPI0011C0501A|nr:hypothetical protein [Paraburkholderia sp. BL6669N2]